LPEVNVFPRVPGPNLCVFLGEQALFTGMTIEFRQVCHCSFFSPGGSLPRPARIPGSRCPCTRRPRRVGDLLVVSDALVRRPADIRATQEADALAAHPPREEVENASGTDNRHSGAAPESRTCSWWPRPFGGRLLGR
jgi:hypothetical protein